MIPAIVMYRWYKPGMNIYDKSAEILAKKGLPAFCICNPEPVDKFGSRLMKRRAKLKAKKKMALRKGCICNPEPVEEFGGCLYCRLMKRRAKQKAKKKWQNRQK